VNLKFLTLDRVKILLSIWPKEEETNIALAYKGNIEELSPGKLLYYLIAPYQRLYVRLQCLELRLSFEEDIMGIDTKLTIIAQATNEIAQSVCLKRVSIGNIIMYGKFYGKQKIM